MTSITSLYKLFLFIIIKFCGVNHLLMVRKFYLCFLSLYLKIYQTCKFSWKFANSKSIFCTVPTMLHPIPTSLLSVANMQYMYQKCYTRYGTKLLNLFQAKCTLVYPPSRKNGKTLFSSIPTCHLTQAVQFGMGSDAFPPFPLPLSPPPIPPPPIPSPLLPRNAELPHYQLQHLSNTSNVQADSV